MTKTLVLELWGLGDAVLMTSVLRTLDPTGRRIVVVAKPPSCRLLAPSHPDVAFVPYDAPWTAFRGKYRLWSWCWSELRDLLWTLRGWGFDEGLSARQDPRDHALLRLSGARQRYGYPRLGSGALLSDPVEAGALRHRVDDWHQLARRIAGGRAELRPPWLDRSAYRGEGPRSLEAAAEPVVVLHCGAAQPVRRWPLPHWTQLVQDLRRLYDFHLAVIPDPDGFGDALRPLADSWLPALSLEGLATVLARAALFLGNDSGPGHLASALSVPAISIFGPQRPELFAPHGADCAGVSRDLCAYRPCKDRCRRPEPVCLTRLDPREVLADVTAHLDRLRVRRSLPATFFTDDLPTKRVESRRAGEQEGFRPTSTA